MSKSNAIKAGVKMVMPLCIGDFPFSFIVGALSVGVGMSVWQSTIWSFFVTAGSAQMLALNILKTGAASLSSIVLMTLFINLRHILYSASMAEHMKEYSIWHKILMSYALTDEVYAVTIKTMQEGKRERVYFYLAAMITFWLTWVLADFAGAILGSLFPDIEKYGLDFAMVAAFIAIVIPQVKSRACIIAASVASVSGVLLVILPYSLGIVVASILGVMAGLAIDLAEEKEQKSQQQLASLKGDDDKVLEGV